MNIMKAYADAGASGRQQLNFVPGKGARQEREPKAAPQKSGGDSLTISPEAMAMLENGGAGSVQAGPQDATYDQYGNVLRQFDELQNDLRRLAAQINAYPGGGSLSGRVNSVRAQLGSLEAQV